MGPSGRPDRKSAIAEFFSSGLMMTVIGPLLTLAIILAIRLRRAGVGRPMSLRSMWIAPSLYLLAVIAVMVKNPPTPLGWTVALVALLLGGALGWQRGQLFDLRLDPETGTLLKRRSPAAVLLLGGVIALRFIAGGVLGALPPSMAPGSAAMLLTDVTMGFLLGLLGFTRIELFVRARRLLQARG
jgi:hypothetical protein